MKDLRLYKGFKPIEFIQSRTNVNAKIEVDGLIYSSHLSNSCDCGIKDPIHGKHRKGCNDFWISTAHYEDRTKDTKILKVRVIPHLKEHFDLHIQIGQIKYDGLVVLDCTCGTYHYGDKISDHPHQDCQKRKKLEMMVTN